MKRLAGQKPAGKLAKRTVRTSRKAYRVVSGVARPLVVVSAGAALAAGMFFLKYVWGLHGDMSKGLYTSAESTLVGLARKPENIGAQAAESAQRGPNADRYGSRNGGRSHIDRLVGRRGTYEEARAALAATPGY